MLAAGMLAAGLGPTAGADPADRTDELPDLVADPVGRAITTTYTDSSGTRALLRFDGYVHNQGSGPLELYGTARSSGEMTEVYQRLYDSDGGSEARTTSPAPRILFENADGHGHWHLHDAAAYSLWNENRTKEVAPAQKVGFCLVDSEHVDPWGPDEAAYTVDGLNFCEQHNPEADELDMGVSPGWRDIYHRDLAFQWVDISDVTPGRYALRSEVDPEGVVIEEDETNPPAFADTVVPGYVAQPFAVEVPWSQPTRLELPVESFGDVDEPRFRIEEAPENGVLDKSEGEWFTGSSVTYIPQPGHSGPDSFRFSARERGNEFPRSPREATASLDVGEAPLPVTLGGDAEQRADVTSGAVQTPRGPGEAHGVPTGSDGDSERRRAPDVSEPLPDPGGSPLARPQVELRHGELLARTVPWHSGTVDLAVIGDGRSLGSCQAEVPAGRPYTCLLASGVTGDELRDARAVATLRSGDHLLDTHDIPMR
ncbi:Lysyl oxidase [Haloechinothrix alba]|uniref:Lysyl oxidase n=2 Tax=Haloechinothrix alba TaxID=664784 RepID=A0A238XD47_9PSEU|nr:Lysyl oxidase [Haloechinothrix alba]